jgi:hypothetical protein
MNGMGKPAPQLGGMPGAKQPGMGYGKGQGANFPGGGMRRRGGGGQPQQPQGFDYDAFNAWQDTTQSDMGVGAGQLQEGWGGFGVLGSRGGNSQMATKMNNYLNQFGTGGERENVMNQMGYFNGGNAFDPASARGSGLNRAYRTQASQMDLSNSVPGQYQAMTPYAEGEDPFTSGGYLGITNVDQSGNAQYTPFAPKGAGRTRRTRNFGQVAY